MRSPFRGPLHDVFRGTRPLRTGALRGGAGAAAGGSLPPPPPTAAGSGARSSASCRSRASTNWASSFLLTSSIMPLPNCAILPVIVRRVSTVTVVASPSGTSRAVIRASALPWPRASRPRARSTAVRLPASCSSKAAVPLYWTVTGPTFTFTRPLYVSPSRPVSWAPGMHGAIRSTSVSSAHAWSGGRLTRNSLVKSIEGRPLFRS